MPFDLSTAIPIREREDGLLEKDTFDLSTARPVEMAILVNQNQLQEVKPEPTKKPSFVLSTLDEANKQLTDLLTVPARLLGTPHPEFKSSLMQGLTQKVYTGRSTLVKEGEIPEEDKPYARPAPNRPGWYEIAEQVPAHIAYAEMAANAFLIGSIGVQGFKAIKTELGIRELARKVQEGSQKFADLFIKTARPEELKAIQTQYQARYDDTILNSRDALVRGFQRQALKQLGAIEEGITPTQTVAQTEIKRMNFFKLLKNELKAINLEMGEAGQALVKRPKVGKPYTFDFNGQMITETVKEIVGNRIEFDSGKIIMLSQLSVPEVTPPKQEGKVVQLKEALNKFNETGTADIIVGKDYGVGIKDEGDYISVRYGPNDLTPTEDIESGKVLYGEKNFSTKEEAFKFAEQIQKELLNRLSKKQLTSPNLPSSPKSSEVGGIPPKEPPKTAVSGEPEPEDFDKLNKDYIRTTPVGKFLTKSANVKQEIANEDFLIKTYENDINKLERQIELGEYQVESEKAKAQVQLENLKQKYTLAKETQRQRKALRDEVAGLVQKIKSAGGEGIAVEYQDAIDKLRDKFDLKKRTEKTTAKREGMRAFVERMKVEGRPIDIPESKLSMLEKVNLEDMTLDQLRDLSRQIGELEKLGKTKLTARKAVYEAKKERVKTELLNEATPINSKLLPKLPIGDKVNSWTERVIALQNYSKKTGVGLTPIDGLADVTGMRGMKKALDADFGKYLTYNDAVIKQWYDLTKDLTEKSFERIGAIAASRQEGGLERLANSGITEEEIRAIKLTPKEEEVLKFVIDTFDREFPAVKQYSKEVYNAEVGEQENYVSFMSDYDLMSDLEIYERFGQTPEQIANRKTKTVEQGFTKERAKVSNIKLELNIDKIFRRHMDDVAYMLNTGKNIKMFFEIINSPEMTEKLGDTGKLAWLQWLDMMARKGGTEGAKRIAALDMLRRNIGAGVLSFRLSSALVQFSSFADTIATIGAEWATRGSSAISTSAEWRNFIMDNFPEIKKAVGDDIAFREFGEGFLSNLSRTGTKPLQVLDGVMRSVAASGAYQKLCAQKGIPVNLNNPDPELIAEATLLMRNSQGSSFFKDQPLAITTGYGLTDNRSVNKLILTFQSFMLNRWDNINRQIWRLGIKEKHYGKAISSLFWMLVFAGALEEGIRRGSRKITNLLSADKKEEKDFATNTLLNIAQSVPLFGQLVSSITYSSNPVPVINTIEDMGEGLGSTIKGKAPETKLKGIIQFLGSLGSLSGVAGSSQAAQILRGMIPKPRSHKIRD